MTNPTTPPTDALQKARELKMEKLLLELQSYLSKVHPKRIFTVIPEIASHLRSQASELERVTAERDAALKGYREMRECMKNIPTHEMDEAGIEFCLGCNEPYQSKYISQSESYIRTLEKEHRAMKLALEWCEATGHNDDCMFCGFKDRKIKEVLLSIAIK